MGAVDELFERGLLWLARVDDTTMLAPNRVLGADGAGPSIAPEIPALITGATHEWIGDLTPHSVLTLLIRDALTHHPTRQALWIGKECWPTPQLISPILSRCLFIDPPDAKLKLWATVSALSSASIASVVVSFPNLSFAKTRQLSIAAQRGGALGLILRASEGSSAAASRWRVTPVPAPKKEAQPKQRYLLELLKIKGAQPAIRSWKIEFHQELYDEEVRIRVLPEDRISEDGASHPRTVSNLGDPVYAVRGAR